MTLRYLLLLLVSLHAFGSTHPFEFEFKDIIYGIDDEMEVCGIYQEPEIASLLSQDELRLAIKTTYLKIKKNKKYLTNQHGDRVVARNNLKRGVIEFSKFGWRRMITDQAQKRSIVLHEYLGILEIEIENYQTSNLILAKIEDCQRRKDSPLDRSHIERGSDSTLATITNRKTGDYLKLVREKNQIHIYLQSSNRILPLKSFSYRFRPENLNLLKDQGVSEYHRLIMDEVLLDCYTHDGYHGPPVAHNALGLIHCGLIGSTVLIVTTPIAAIQEIIRAISGHGSKDIAYMKFNKALIGKNTNISNVNFKKLVELIEEYKE